MSARISLIVPTQRRPEGLMTAVRSLLAQTGVAAADLELVIVDNDKRPSAKLAAITLAEAAAFPVLYVHQPAPGVANARNAGMARASGELIAFLDDDEEAPAGWLAALIAQREASDADVVFGPVRARAPAGVARHRAYFERFFSRVGPDGAGLIDHYYGCGNSLIRRAALPDWCAPFSAERNHIGGEDDLLFRQMKTAGKRFAWAPAAWVWEDPLPQRVKLAYTLRRAFAYGQGPSEDAVVRRDWPRLAFWMAVGLGQAAVFGLVAAGKWLIGAPDRAETLDRAARGLGKTLWGGPFKIQFYGLG